MQKGAAVTAHLAATQTADCKTSVGRHNALIVHHYMTGDGASGHVTLEMAPLPDGQMIDHHGKGTNIPTEDSNKSYTAIFEGLMDYVNVKLNCTAGTHTVVIQPLIL